MPKLIVLILALLPLYAIAARPEHEGPHHPSCDFGAVNACIEENRALETRARADALALEPELRGYAATLDGIRRVVEEDRARLELLRVESAALGGELAAGAESAASSEKILGGLLAPEELFSLHPLERSWFERGRPTRALKLTARLEQASREISDLDAHMEKNSSEYAHLNDEYQARNAEHVHLETRAREHAGMCNGGCRAERCGPPET